MQYAYIYIYYISYNFVAKPSELSCAMVADSTAPMYCQSLQFENRSYAFGAVQGNS